MHGVLTWDDVHPDVQAQIRELQPTAARARAQITGDGSNMIAHVAAVDADCSEAFKKWLAGQPERARLDEERAEAERARLGKTRDELVAELAAELRKTWR
jgi:hypothetical protein